MRSRRSTDLLQREKPRGVAVPVEARLEEKLVATGHLIGAGRVRIESGDEAENSVGARIQSGEMNDRARIAGERTATARPVLSDDAKAIVCGQIDGAPARIDLILEPGCPDVDGVSPRCSSCGRSGSRRTRCSSSSCLLCLHGKYGALRCGVMNQLRVRKNRRFSVKGRRNPRTGMSDRMNDRMGCGGRQTRCGCGNGDERGCEKENTVRKLSCIFDPPECSTKHDHMGVATLEFPDSKICLETTPVHRRVVSHNRGTPLDHAAATPTGLRRSRQLVLRRDRRPGLRRGRRPVL
jgi:hypothetical protein